jgi:hypothetical protein
MMKSVERDEARKAVADSNTTENEAE